MRMSVYFRRDKQWHDGVVRAQRPHGQGTEVVSKKMHANGKEAFSYIKAWHVAVKKARQALGVNGFVAIGGQRPEGKALYAKAKAILEGK